MPYNPDRNHAGQVIVSPEASRKGMLLFGAVPAVLTELQNHQSGNPIYWGDPNLNFGTFQPGDVPSLTSAKYHFCDVIAMTRVTSPFNAHANIRHIRNPSAAGTLADPQEYWDNSLATAYNDHRHYGELPTTARLMHNRAADKSIFMNSDTFQFYTSGSNMIRQPILPKAAINAGDPWHFGPTCGLVTRTGAILLHCAARHSSNTTIGQRNMRIWRSTDRGFTWTKVYDAPPLGYVDPGFTGSFDFQLGRAQGGASSDTSDVAAFALLGTINDGSTIGDGDHTVFLRTTDDGLTWTALHPQGAYASNTLGRSGYIRMGDFHRNDIGGTQRYAGVTYKFDNPDPNAVGRTVDQVGWVYTDDFGLTVQVAALPATNIATPYVSEEHQELHYGDGTWLFRRVNTFYRGTSMTNLTQYASSGLDGGQPAQWVKLPIFSNGKWWACRRSWPYMSTPIGDFDLYRSTDSVTWTFDATLPWAGGYIISLHPTDSPLHHVAGKSHREMVQWGLNSFGSPLYG